MSLYQEHGLGSVTLRQVAERCGTSHALVYRYFDDKDCLLTELRLICLAELQNAVRCAVDVGASPFKQLELALSALMNFGYEEPAKYRLVFAHEQPSLDHHTRLRDEREALFSDCRALIEAAARQQGLHIDALVYTHGFWSLIHGMLSLHTAGQLVHGCDLDHLAGPLLDLLLRPFNPATAPPSSAA